MQTSLADHKWCNLYEAIYMEQPIYMDQQATQTEEISRTQGHIEQEPTQQRAKTPEQTAQSIQTKQP